MAEKYWQMYCVMLRLRFHALCLLCLSGYIFQGASFFVVVVMVQDDSRICGQCILHGIQGLQYSEVIIAIIISFIFVLEKNILQVARLHILPLMRVKWLRWRALYAFSSDKWEAHSCTPSHSHQSVCVHLIQEGACWVRSFPFKRTHEHQC